jgi:translin
VNEQDTPTPRAGDSQTGYAGQLDEFCESARKALDTVHGAREAALADCRRTVRAAGLAIRAVHIGDQAMRARHLAQATDSLRSAQGALEPFPEVAAAGFLHDAEKEVAEAFLTAAMVDGRTLPDATEVGVRLPAWLNGLAEAASELRRAVLDALRRDDTPTAQRLFGAMEEVADMLVTIDHPDAITGGLRRTTDALRAVVERTRADLTTTLVQERLQKALRALP